MKKKSLGGVKGAETRLKWEEEIVGVQIVGQLMMNMFLEKLTGNRKK